MNRVPADWLTRFGFEPVLLETFVDPVRYRGTCYKASGWDHVGSTRGFRRDGREFYTEDSSPKQIWLRPLRRDAAELLRSEQLPAELRAFEASLPPRAVAKRLGSERMHSLFEALGGIDDPRREQGRRHSMACCLAIMVCGVLGGCHGMCECAEFGASLTQKQLKAPRAWPNRGTGRRTPPSRDTLWRVMTCFRSLAALLLARGKESTRVLQRRLSGKPHLLLYLLKSSGAAECEKRAKPYAASLLQTPPPFRIRQPWHGGSVACIALEEVYRMLACRSVGVPKRRGVGWMRSARLPGGGAPAVSFVAPRSRALAVKLKMWWQNR